LIGLLREAHCYSLMAAGHVTRFTPSEYGYHSVTGKNIEEKIIPTCLVGFSTG
jgi:hypothetical protein